MPIMEQSAPSAVASQFKTPLRSKVLARLGNLGLPIAMIVLILLFGVGDPRFLTYSNAENVMRQGAVLVVVSLAQTFAIVSGSIDLSVGSALGLASVVTALVASQAGLAVGYAAGIATGALVGAVNGYFVATWRLNSIIVTLGMLSIAKGLAFIISGGITISDVPDSFSIIGLQSVGHFPLMALIALVAFVVSLIILQSTSLGRLIYATGGNAVAANLSGVRVVRYRFLGLLASGIFVGIAAILASSRVNSGNPLTGTGYELQSIAAVVVGGVSLRGGEGKVWGSVLGAILIAMLANGLNLIGLSSYLQSMITGAILVLAVVIDQALHRQAV